MTSLLFRLNAFNVAIFWLNAVKAAIFLVKGRYHRYFSYQTPLTLLLFLLNAVNDATFPGKRL